MSPIIDLLNRMRPRVGMYIGKPSITRLAFFLRGYDFALEEKGVADSFLADFRDWIHKRYGCNTASWEELILAEAASEPEALDRFWQLFDEYVAATSGESGSREVPALR